MVPEIYVFPASIVASGLRYFYGGRFSKSSSYMFVLDLSLRGSGRNLSVPTVSQYIGAYKYIDNYLSLGMRAVAQ